MQRRRAKAANGAEGKGVFVLGWFALVFAQKQQLPAQLCAGGACPYRSATFLEFTHCRPKQTQWGGETGA